MSFLRSRSTIACALGVLLAVSSATAQQGPDVVDLALAWARGGYASPVVCRFGDEVKRGLRRIVIVPGPRTSALRVDRVTFHDLAATGSTRCNDELGAEEPNIIGTLLITYSSKRPRSDTPQRDIEQALKSGPLDFGIESGRLRIGGASLARDALRDVDFAGGKLFLGEIPAGSDDARRLGDFASTRRLRLDAEAPDGTRIGLAIVEYERR